MEGSEREKRERGDWPLGTGVAVKKRDKRRRDRQVKTWRMREGWEVGRALLKGNVVNVHRRYS